MVWICFIIGLILGGLFGIVVCYNIKGIKGIIVGVIITLFFGLLFGGGSYLDNAIRVDKWNDGYCPNCNVHWTPYGASESNFVIGRKYYYCEKCHKEIEL